MKPNRLWILIGLTLLLGMVLSGCNLVPNAQAESGGQTALDRAAWPTPVPTEAQPTPTPFPKVNQRQTISLQPTPRGTPDPSSGESPIGPAPTGVAGESLLSSPEGVAVSSNVDGTAPLTEVPTSPVEEETPAETNKPAENASANAGPGAQATSTQVIQLATVAQAHPISGNVLVRRGPGEQYDAVSTLDPGDTLNILAHDVGNRWLLVDPDNMYDNPGWVFRADLVPDTIPDGTPVVTTAWVKSNEVAVRNGPAIYHPQVGVLNLNDLVIVLGQDKDGGWCLVQPFNGGSSAWVPVQFIDLGGDWRNVAVVSDSDMVPDDTLTQSALSETGSPPESQPVQTRNLLAVQLASGGDIVLIHSDGTNLRTLTHGIDPVLSPDGSQVAFTRWGYGGELGSLWTINVDGSNERQILGEMRKAKGADWSPDGSQIVLNFQDGGRLDFRQKCVNLIEVAAGEESYHIPWNADDVRTKEGKGGIPYLCWKLPPDAYWSLRVVNVADGVFEDLYGGTYAFRPAWDPIQTWRVVADSGYGLIQTDIDDDSSLGLTEKVGDGSAAISPDGRYIALVSNENNGYDIHRVNSDGNGRIRLTKTPLWVTAQPGDSQVWKNVAPEWSPDGSRIAFLTNRTGRWEIWVMNADGSDQHPMFDDQINDQLPIQYDFNDERVLSWR